MNNNKINMTEVLKICAELNEMGLREMASDYLILAELKKEISELSLR